MRVAVTGSGGLIGGALVRELRSAGHDAVPVVRREPAAGEIRWDLGAASIDVDGLRGCDAVVNLAGAGIGDHRWTATNKARIRDSRMSGTGLLAETIASLDAGPSVLLNASASGWYGDRGDEVLTESSDGGSGFLAGVCRDWEEAAQPAADAGIRVVFLRSGIVLARDGGVIPIMARPFHLFAGGPVGSGRQWVSWIDLRDHIGAIVHLLEREAAGPVNLVSPNPVSNADFARALGKALHRPSWLRTPAAMVEFVAGRERVRELLLASQRLVPEVLQESGFAFRFPEIEPALRSIFAGA